MTPSVATEQPQAGYHGSDNCYINPMPRFIAILKILLILQIPVQTISCTNTKEISKDETAKPVVWDGSANTSWYDKSQREFTITTPEQLAGLAELVYEGKSFYCKTIKLGADIVLNDTTDWQNWESKPPKNKWKPIGGVYSGFDGFGSCCHPPTPGLLLDLPIALILYPIPDFIKRPLKLLPSEILEFKGAFDGNGYAISGIYINSPNKGDAGLFELTGGSGDCGGNLRNVTITASYINGNNRTGGLVGYNDNGKIINSSFNGTVIGKKYVGGLAGVNRNTIINSYSTGIVKGDSSVGGLAGSTYNIINSYSTSTVSGDSEVGGLAGFNWQSIMHSYFAGKVTGKAKVGELVGTTRGTIVHSYHDMQTATFTDWDFAGTWSIDEKINNGYPYLQENNREKIIPRGSRNLSISTPQELIEFAKLVKEGNDFKGKTVKLENDIMFNDTAEWKSWDSVPPANQWPVIGGIYKNKFSGTFDGNGKVISGVYRKAANDYQGLFSTLDSGGTIKNLGLAASYIKGGSFTGGLVGINYGDISKCYSVGKVIGEYNVGGLVGVNRGTISKSYSSTSIVAKEVPSYYDRVVGGLVGLNDRTISDSYSVTSADGLTGVNRGEVIRSYYGPQMYKDTFKGWDFKEVWVMDSTTNNGHTYFHPYLK